MSELISIIIPVYNIEKYIANCLESVVSQTYNNIEVIVIDDGSNDKTGEICDIYASKYRFIQVHHQQNSGVCVARNYGLNTYSGNWVFFLDGDDTLVSNALELAKKIADDTKCLMVDFNFSRVTEGKTISGFEFYTNSFIEDNIKCLNSTLLYKRALIYPKLYHRSIINHIRFNPKITIGEDIVFNIEIYKGPHFNISHNTEKIYLYLLRNGSAMQNSRTYCEYERLNNVVTEYLSNDIEVNKNLILFCCINYYFKCIKERALLSSQYSKIYNRLSFKDCWDKDLSFKFKLLFSAYKLNRNLGNLLLYLRYKLFPVY